MKAFIKVCHKLLPLKSRELCDGCGISYANILRQIKNAPGEYPLKNIVGVLRDAEAEYDQHHRFDCLVLDPFRFATFHIAFAFSLAATEGNESFSMKCLK